MSRLDDAILQNDRAYAAGTTHPMLDPVYGGVMGWSPDPRQWVSKTGYVRRNIIPILIESPRGFRYLPNSDDWNRTLRSLIETHPLSIDGFQSTLTVETSETPFGGAGEQFQDVTNVTRARTQPSFVLPDLYGAPIKSFLERYITYLIMDPETKTALINTITQGEIPPDMLADMYAFTTLFIEPDVQQNHVLNSWLTTNMFPLSGGEIVGKRDITTSMEAVRYTIPFSGVTQTGLGVNVLAKEILDGIKIAGANPYHRNAFLDSIRADVLAAKSSYANGVADLASNSVRV